MKQIVPIEIVGRKNKGLYLEVYYSLNGNICRAEILDAFKNVIFGAYITAKTIEDVAQKLSLKILNK